MEKTFLRTYLDRKEQNEVKNIYKMYGWNATSFNEACAAITCNDAYYVNSFKTCCQDPSDENLEKFFCSWRVYQASYKKNSVAKKECGKQLIPYLTKVLKQFESEKRKSEMENSLAGFLTGDELVEKFKNKFFIVIHRVNNYVKRGSRGELNEQYRATFSPYEINEAGEKQKDRYGYAQRISASFTIYSNEQGYFDDSVIEKKLKEESTEQIAYYKKQMLELENKIKTLNDLLLNVKRWLA